MLLTWEEFLAVAKQGTTFEFYANEDKDFGGDLAKQIGEVCTVSDNPFKGDSYSEWCVSFHDSKGVDWCFYQTNYGERNASFRIISQPEVIVPDDIPDWEKDLYNSQIAADELKASQEAVQQKIKEAYEAKTTQEAVNALTDALYPKPSHMSMTYWQKLPNHLKKAYVEYYN